MPARRPPPWWPAGEPWPPRRGTWRGRNWGSNDPAAWAGPPWAAGAWGGRRGGFMRRMGCLFAFVVLLAVGAGAAIVWTIGAAFGAISAGPFGHAGLLVSVAI